MATIKPRRGTTAPTTGLSQYELAVDTTNKRIYIGNAGGSGDLIGSAPGGSDTQIQFNDSGVMGGDSGLTFNKTTDALTVSGDINANGGAIKTSQTTFNLANSTATTLNAGGAATAINMGSATCTTTISGGTVLGSTTTQALFDTVATTMNFARTATSITMGAATGFTAIRNPTFRLGSTTAAITTTSGASANNLTLEPFGKLRIVPTTNLSNGGSIPSLIVENSDQASGVVEIAGGDLYLGNKTVDDINYTPVNIIFEGGSNNTSETTLTVEEPTADRTITLPDATGTVAVLGTGSTTDGRIPYYDTTTKTLLGASYLSYNDGTNTLTLDSTVNIGSTLGTSNSTANLLNSVATTINFGGQATTMSVGAATGTITINNNLSVSGAVTSSGGYRVNSSAINAQTDSYTLQASDNGKIVTMNASSLKTITVPSGLSVGFNCTIIRLGTGRVSFVASSTTINSVDGLVEIASQHGSASLFSYSSDTYNLSGNLG